MIKIKDQLPSVYYDASRDFQVLGHLYEVVLNYSKTNTDMLYLLPNNIESDTRATELLATTLGFKIRRNYDKAQLAALVSIFPRLLKVKGTKQAIDLAGKALVKASGVQGEFDSKIDADHVLTVKIPIELSDITLFMDLLPYILPFGLRVSIVRNTIISRTVTPPPIGAKTMVQYEPIKYETGQVYPLGLVKINYNEDESTNSYSYSVNYSSSNFIDQNNQVIAGQLGASPILTFDLYDTDLDTEKTTHEEDDT